MFLILHAGQVQIEKLIIAPFPQQSPEEKDNNKFKLGLNIWITMYIIHM
jgi:hypothetical protein